MRYLTILILLLLVIHSGCANTQKQGTVGDIKTKSGKALTIKWNEIEGMSYGELSLNYYKDSDIAIVVGEAKQMVSAWFWCWFFFTLLLAGVTEIVGYIPKVGFIFKFLGKRLSSLALACIGWLFIKYVMGGGYIFTITITILSLLTANIGWELLINWIGSKVKNKFIKKIKPI